MSATVTPIDAEGHDLQYGNLYIAPSGLIYLVKEQAFSTSQMVWGHEHHRRQRGWKERAERKLLSADVLIPIASAQRAELPIRDAQRHGRALYTALYRNGPARDRTRGHIAEHKRQVAAVRAKFLGGE